MKLANLEGKTLAGRFRLESILGSGGYGAVFEAVQLSVGRRCAVKVLFPHLCNDEATVERFRAEARTTSRLTHPNSVIIYDFGRDDTAGLLFLAMELLEGQDLRSIVRQQRWLSVDQTVHVISQAAASLQEAHELGLVHRDIKPHNIMLLERGSDSAFVKVIDFGIAKVVRSGMLTAHEVTRTGTVIGTPKYMAPEQIRDSGVDGRTDMYGLAITAYQMLVGRTPFEEGTALEIAGRQIAETPEPPSAFRPDLRVSDAFEQVLLKALAKDADDRFDTVSEFAGALEDAVERQSDTRPSGRSLSADATSVSLIIGEPTKMMTSDSLEAPASGEEAADEANEVDEGDEGDERAKKPGAHTLETMALPGSGSSAADAEKKRDGTTAEVGSRDDEAGEPTGPRASAWASTRGPMALLAGAAVALLVFVVGGLMRADSDADDAAHSGVAASEKASSAEQALTAGVAARPAKGYEETDEPDENQGRHQGDSEAGEGAARASSEADSETDSSKNHDSGKWRFERQPDEEPRETPEESGEREEPNTTAGAGDESARPPEKGSVEVRVIPWGTLYVNGRQMGEGARHKLDLRSGRHRLVLKQAGQVRARRTVDVSPRSSKLIELVAH